MSTPTALLLPPVGHDSSHWSLVRARVETSVDVLAYDYPGFGANERAFDYDAPDLLVRIVDDVVAFAASRAPQIDLLGGTSLGGTLAFAIEAALDPKPRSLLLVASSGLPVASVRKFAIRDALRELGEREFVRAHLGFALADGDPRIHAMVALLDAALEIDFRAEMSARSRRVTVVFGDEDRVFPRTHPDRLTASIPSASLVRLPGVGHFPPREAPDVVGGLLRAALFDRSHP